MPDIVPAGGGKIKGFCAKTNCPKADKNNCFGQYHADVHNVNLAGSGLEWRVMSACCTG